MKHHALEQLQVIAEVGRTTRAKFYREPNDLNVGLNSLNRTPPGASRRCTRPNISR